MTKNIVEFYDERELVSAAVALGATGAGGRLASEEVDLIQKASSVKIAGSKVSKLREAILKGQDPLGDGFSLIRTPETRREHGATYTPSAIVQTMIQWAVANSEPERVIDPGVGSARFLAASGVAFPDARLVGIDIDPLATVMARANLAVMGMGDRSQVILGDFRDFDEQVEGQTLYIGNPPYVRHHQIEPKWKNWLAAKASELDLPASKLAGLHVYFFLATAASAKPCDAGAFITASEWLDVNYGSLVRSLILGDLGGKSITVIEPTAQPFPDAATTAAITTFEVGAVPQSVNFRRVDSLGKLGDIAKGRKVHRDRLAVESRWSHLTRAAERPPEGYVELGEICRVHRGTVTGANGVWIAGQHSEGLPESVLFPTVTRAREVLDADGLLTDAGKLRQVIDLPTDLDELEKIDRDAVLKFLKTARAMGANAGYVARNRKAWWSVGLRAAAPIISTYMARRPPGFVINKADARHINVAHGLYPREEISEAVKKALVAYLQVNVSQRSGRTYAGGLTKFEPREMERLIVPSPEMLAAGVAM